MKNSEAVCSICHRKLEKKIIERVGKYGRLYDVYLCNDCMVGYTIQIPSSEDLSRLYSSENYRSKSGKRFNILLEVLVFIFRLFRKKRIEKYIKKGSLLDIGCGRGLFLNIMKRNGWDVTGIEFNEETASYASETYDIHVKAGNNTAYHAFPPESFDVITMNHVLEHIYKPDEIIAECRRLLRRGGILVIAVPDMFSLQASAGKRVWFHLDIPYHLCHFTEEGLSALLKKNSFKILNMRRFDLEYNPFGWLQTLLNLSGIGENLFYNLLKSPEIRARALSTAKRGDLILTFIVLPVYLPLSFILAAVESLLLKRGGTFEAYATKE